MFRFEHIDYLYLLLLIPFILLIYILVGNSRKKALEKYGESGLLNHLRPYSSSIKVNFKFILMILAYTALVFALARPQNGTKLKDVKRKGIELVIALDVSNSMLAEDIKPSRLEKAKMAISKLIDRLENDKIALIVFAGDAYVQVPMTTDYSAAKMLLSSLNTGIVPKQGTSIGKAIEMAVKSFSSEGESNRAVIIITDGENHEDDAINAAEIAANEGIIIHTIGMGLAQGGPIPVYGQYGQKDYRKDREGNVIVTKLDENLLKKVADAGKGSYIRANNTKTGLNALFNELNKIEKQEIKAKIYSEYQERYQYFIALALILIALDVFVLNRKNKFLQSLKLFEKK